jgi:hypothetical protein
MDKLGPNGSMPYLVGVVLALERFYRSEKSAEVQKETLATLIDVLSPLTFADDGPREALDLEALNIEAMADRGIQKLFKSASSVGGGVRSNLMHFVGLLTEHFPAVFVSGKGKTLLARKEY